jgi:hypothetical protein
LVWKTVGYSAKIEGERRNKKKIVVRAKLEGCFMHAPPLHGEDARMNLKTLCNDVLITGINCTHHLNTTGWMT